MKFLLLVVLFSLIFVCGAAPDGDLTIILITVMSDGKHFFDHFFLNLKLTKSLKRLFLYTFLNQTEKYGEIQTQVFSISMTTTLKTNYLLTKIFRDIFNMITRI